MDLGSKAYANARVSNRGASYVSWTDDTTVMFNFTNHIFEWAQGDGAKVKKVARIHLDNKSEASSDMLAVVGAKIVPMSGKSAIQYGTILIRGSRIVDIGESSSVQVPSGARVINVKGATIIPGLIDTHAHYHIFSSREYLTQRKEEYEASLAYGVTTIFDPSAPTLDVMSNAELVEFDEMLGPRVFSAGLPVQGDRSSQNYVQIESLSDAKRAVDRLVDSGAVMIKEYTLPRRDQRQWLKQAADERRISVTGEGANDQMLDLTMAFDGYGSIEHSFPITPLYEDVVRFLAKRRIVNTPTFMVADAGSGEMGRDYFEGQHVCFLDKAIRPQSDHRPFTDSVDWKSLQRDTCLEATDSNIAQLASSLKTLIDRGGRVSVGAHGYRAGLGSHWEMWALTLGGFTPMDALRSATITGAEKIGVDKDLGSLEVGKLADFLVIDGDPSVQITDSVKTMLTVKNGVVYDSQTLTEVFPNYSVPGRPYWLSDIQWESYLSRVPESPSGELRK